MATKLGGQGAKWPGGQSTSRSPRCPPGARHKHNMVMWRSEAARYSPRTSWEQVPRHADECQKWTCHAPRSWRTADQEEAIASREQAGWQEVSEGASTELSDRQSRVARPGEPRGTARCNRPLGVPALLVGGDSLLSFPVGRATQPVDGFWGKGAGSDR